MIKVGLGQDSHRFEDDTSVKPLMLGGVMIGGYPGLRGNSDADVVLHALTNAISGITGVNILGAISDELCLQKGITDSAAYVRVALSYMKDYRIVHASFSMEGKRPIMAPHIDVVCGSIARILQVEKSAVTMTATSGEGMTPFGQGIGIQVLAIVTAMQVIP